MGKTQIPIHVLQTEKPDKLFFLTHSQYVANLPDGPANRSMSGRNVRVHQKQQTHFQLLCLHLPGHFIGEQAPITIPTHKVWAFRLHSAHCSKVRRRHFFKGWRERKPLKLIGFEQVKWLLWTQVPRQFPAIESSTFPFSVQVEEGPS